MRDRFAGHFKRSDDDLKKLWSKATFVVDANVLLNVYRYSPRTKSALIGALNAIEPRLWIPHQALAEFFKNRFGVIDKQIGAYDDAISKVTSLLEDLRSDRKHPFVDPDMLQRTEATLSALTTELAQRKATQEHLLNEDPDLDVIAKLFGNRMGTEPTPEQLEGACKLAESRIANKVPPGYRDCDKADRGSYGDVLIWMQTLEHAVAKKSPVIFVTDDAKDDWWLIVRGKTIGPRPELLHEFRRRTGLDFHMYQPGQFIEFSGQQKGTKVDSTAVEEARAFTAERARRREHSLYGEKDYEYLRTMTSHLLEHENEVHSLATILADLGVTSPEARRPSDLSRAARIHIRRLLKECPCAIEAMREFRGIPAPTYHDIDAERVAPKKAWELIARIRHVPDSMFSLAQQIDDLMRRRDSETSPPSVK